VGIAAADLDPALVLVTAIDGTPALAFGQGQVIRIELSAAQAHSLP
jgi:hypothetical protein